MNNLSKEELLDMVAILSREITATKERNLSQIKALDEIISIARMDQKEKQILIDSLFSQISEMQNCLNAVRAEFALNGLESKEVKNYVGMDK
jgi:hypothetical protein